LCFFFRIRLRRFLIKDPIGGGDSNGWFSSGANCDGEHLFGTMAPMPKEQAVQLRLEGKSRSQIATALGLKSGGGALTRWLKDVPVPEWTKRPNAKDDLRACAIELRKQGRSYGEILEEVAVSKSTLSEGRGDAPRTTYRAPAGDQRFSAGADPRHR
jgi:hypothetical protein